MSFIAYKRNHGVILLMIKLNIDLDLYGLIIELSSIYHVEEFTNGFYSFNDVSINNLDYKINLDEKIIEKKVIEFIKKFTPKRIPAFGYSKEPIEILYVRPYSVGMKYYSLVDYQGALPYAVLEEEIATYLTNLVQSGFSPSTIVNFNNGVPTPEEQEILSRKVIGKLTGSKGQKVVVAFNNNQESKTTVDSIPLDDAPEHYQYLSEECAKKIMVAHNITSPLLMGLGSANGFSSLGRIPGVFGWTNHLPNLSG